MLQANRLRARLAVGQRVYGLINSIPAPLLVEMIGYAGFDFVILDLEHVGVNPQTLEDLIRAADCCGLTPLVRVPGVEPGTILRALDAGAQGTVVPRWRTRSMRGRRCGALATIRLESVASAAVAPPASARCRWRSTWPWPIVRSWWWR